MAQQGPRKVTEIIVKYNDGSASIISRSGDSRLPVEETSAVKDLERFLGIPTIRERQEVEEKCNILMEAAGKLKKEAARLLRIPHKKI